MERKRVSLVWFGRGITNVEIKPKTQQTLIRIISSNYSHSSSNIQQKASKRKNAIISENVSNLGKSLLEINEMHSIK